jgi:hypothetical protein
MTGEMAGSGSYPFNAPEARPLTKSLWKTRNKIVTGREIMSTPALINP